MESKLRFLLLLSLKKSIYSSVTSSLAAITYLSQPAENNLEVLGLGHLPSDGIQVLFNSGGTEAAVELVYVVIDEGERHVADGHLGDHSYSAPIY